MNFLNGFAAGMGESAYMVQARMKAEIDSIRTLNEIRAMNSMYRTGDGCWVGPPASPRATKCHGCGSHEWRQHNNVRICAYCRSGQ